MNVCVCQYSVCDHADQLVELHLGQGKDIYWRDNHTCPTEQEYIQMVRESEWSVYVCRQPYSYMTTIDLFHISSPRNWGTV